MVLQGRLSLSMCIGRRTNIQIIEKECVLRAQVDTNFRPIQLKYLVLRDVFVDILSGAETVMHPQCFENMLQLIRWNHKHCLEWPHILIKGEQRSGLIN